jgi:hypothetical protein
LDLERVPESLKSQVKNEVGELLIEEIINSVAGGVSPVDGSSFKTLTKKYADIMKGGDRFPNLELDGDMLSAITFEELDDGVEIGIFDPNEVPKADNHNKFSSESKRTSVPKRQFIPKGKENFVEEIMERIENIISEYELDSDELVDAELSELIELLQGEELVTGINLDAQILEALDFLLSTRNRR